MKIREMMTKVDGFLNFIAKDYTTVKNNRIALVNVNTILDLHNYCEDLCVKKCGGEPEYNCLDNEARCLDCEDCEVSMLYVNSYKLFLLEELMREQDKESEDQKNDKA